GTLAPAVDDIGDREEAHHCRRDRGRKSGAELFRPDPGTETDERDDRHGSNADFARASRLVALLPAALDADRKTDRQRHNESQIEFFCRHYLQLAPARAPVQSGHSGKAKEQAANRSETLRDAAPRSWATVPPHREDRARTPRAGS